MKGTLEAKSVENGKVIKKSTELNIMLYNEDE